MAIAPFTNNSNSATISTSERSLPANTTSGVPTSQTTVAKIQILLDLSALVAGDWFRCKIYEKVNGGTQRVVETFDFVGASGQFLFLIWLSEGWDVTLIKVAGTDRAIAWSLREDDDKASSANQTSIIADTSNILTGLGVLKVRQQQAATTTPPIKLSESTAARRRVMFVVVDQVTSLGVRRTGLVDAGFRALMAKNANVTAAGEAGTFTEVDATNMPGVYRYEFTAGEIDTLGFVAMEIEYFDGVWLHVTELRVPIVAYDPFDAVSLGLSAVNSNVVSIANNAITAASIANNAITAAKIATAAFTAAKFDSALLYLLGLLRFSTGAATYGYTAQGGSSSTITLDLFANAQDDFFAGVDIVIVGGTGYSSGPQVRNCTAYNGTTKVATVSPNWAITPDATTLYVTRNGGAGGGGATATDVRDAILDFEYRTGRTVRGLFRRLGAAVEGKATGLLGTLATFFQPDGTTEEFKAAQNTVAGTRSTATVTNSEVP